MKFRPVRLAVSLTVALAPLPAAIAAEPSANDVLIAAFESGDCQITNDQVDAAFEAAGLAIGDSVPAIIALANAGKIAFSDDGNTAYLRSGPVCESTVIPSVAVDPEAHADVVALFETSDCALPMKGSAFDSLRASHSNDAIERVLIALMADNALFFADGISTLKTGRVCGSKP